MKLHPTLFCTMSNCNKIAPKAGVQIDKYTMGQAMLGCIVRPQLPFIIWKIYFE